MYVGNVSQKGGFFIYVEEKMENPMDLGSMLQSLFCTKYANFRRKNCGFLKNQCYDCFCLAK
jgi:hypothetical protein